MPTHLIGAVIGFLSLTVPAMMLMHKMGGDIKFITILGLYLGTPLTVLLLLLACTFMLIYSLVIKLVTKNQIRKKVVPFAPFFLTAFVFMFLITIPLKYH